MPKDDLDHKGYAYFKLEGELQPFQVERLRRKLVELKGVLAVRMNYIMDIVSVNYDPQVVSWAKIKKIIDLSKQAVKD